MTKYRLWIVLLFLSGVSHAQQLALADSLRTAGNFAAAVKAYSGVLQTGKVLPALDSGNLYMRRGICYFELNDKEPALQDYFVSLKIFERHDLPDRIAAACTNIARVYGATRDFNNAEKYRLRSLQLYRQLNDSFHVAFVMNDLALLKYELKQYDEAISLHTAALLDYKAVMNDDLVQRHLYNKGNCYEISDQDSSLFYYKKAMEVALRSEDSSMLSVIYSSIGDVYRMKKDWPQAIRYQELGLELNEGYGTREERLIILRLLTDICFESGQYERGYRYLKEERILDEELYTIAKTKMAAELAEKYESEKKDEKIRSQEMSNRLKQRNLILSIGGLLLAIALTFITYLSYLRKKKANKELNDKNIRIQLLNKALDSSNQVKSKLFSVISHDLRAPVSSLYAYLQLRHQNNADERNSRYIAQTEQLLETMEDLLIWSKSQMHQFELNPEKVNIAAVFRQMITLFQDTVAARQLTIQNFISPHLQVYVDPNLFNILLRNIMVNAVRYAAAGSTVVINATETKENILISVRNTVDPAHAGTVELTSDVSINSRSSGLGNTLIRDFADLLSCTIRHTSSADSIEVSVFVPVNLSVHIRS